MVDISAVKQQLRRIARRPGNIPQGTAASDVVSDFAAESAREKAADSIDERAGKLAESRLSEVVRSNQAREGLSARELSMQRRQNRTASLAGLANIGLTYAGLKAQSGERERLFAIEEATILNRNAEILAMRERENKWFMEHMDQMKKLYQGI